MGEAVIVDTAKVSDCIVMEHRRKGKIIHHTEVTDEKETNLLTGRVRNKKGGWLWRFLTGCK